jgi:lipopolysaccharide/colanic/teichoic acid biosynthesis glycosyltransferase
VPLLVAIGEEEAGLKSDFMSIPLVDDVVLAKNVNQRLVNHVRLLLKAKRASKEQRFEQKVKQDLNQTQSGINLGKRMFDIFVSGTLLLLLSPLMALIALAIRLESRGPIFYIAKRAGRGYQVFDFFKFRSMRVDADQQIASLSHLNQYDASSGKPVFFKLNNDPRVTRVGNFLRNTSLDELPQLFNVFIGDMSLVGNRPLPLYEAATLTTDEWATRFLAPAGITGLWQIKKRGKAEMSVEERIQLDIDYANKHGFLFDLYIMALTPAALVQKSNV